MKITFLGTSDSGMVPVYGCPCFICKRALKNESFRRGKTSAFIEINNKLLLIDANNPKILTDFSDRVFDKILVTHFHMDHVQTLFDLRWGISNKIKVISPNDTKGCDGLYKNNGILDFSQKAEAFRPFFFEDIKITPIPLNHSRPCFGYLFSYMGKNMAYLTDTNSLSNEAMLFLKDRIIDWAFIDCTHPPIKDREAQTKRNHNDFNEVLVIKKALNIKRVGLIHLSHDMLCWAEENPSFFSDKVRVIDDEDIIKI